MKKVEVKLVMEGIAVIVSIIKIVAQWENKEGKRR